uniref:PH domain-containing protein n=1 Tax=Peronospora matthiolae TaxID=2874970 RepID=A0AAV1UQ19_9STRA
MTCAGYLVLDNTYPAFVEVVTGVLVCSLVECRIETPEPSLPPLEPRLMTRMEVPSAYALKFVDGKYKQVDGHAEDERKGFDEPLKRQRLLQLSGYLVEVLEQDEDLREPSLACSFQVNTYKVHIEPDGGSSSFLHDSLILTATDEETKNLWVKHIKLWNRYGWRETVPVGATQTELARLEEMLQRVSSRSTLSSCDARYSSDECFYRDCNSAVMIYGGCRSFDTDRSSCATRRPTKRRFYRTAVPGSFAPPV